jgi:DNA-binding response OmpR family regulator
LQDKRPVTPQPCARVERRQSVPDGRIEFLLVEDNEHDITAVRRAWKTAGLPHLLNVVPGGRSCLCFLEDRNVALSKGERPPPLVVILDDRMATMDGVDVLKEIRESDALCHIPVVMLMSSDENYRELKTYRLGANAYIVKPMKFEKLVNAIDLIVRFWELAEIPEA